MIMKCEDVEERMGMQENDREFSREGKKEKEKKKRKN